MTGIERQPHQNVSKLIVPMAAQQWFINGTDPEKFIRNHAHKSFVDPTDNPAFDFLISTKIPRSSRLVTCPVLIEGYDYSLKYGYDKLPSLKTIQKDSNNDEFEVMHIRVKRTRLPDTPLPPLAPQDHSNFKSLGSLVEDAKKLKKPKKPPPQYSEETLEIHLGEETEQNRVARYFVSNTTNDPFLIKKMPPLKAKEGEIQFTEERLFSLEAGFHVSMATDISDFSWDRLNFDYYLMCVEKLIDIPKRLISDL